MAGNQHFPSFYAAVVARHVCGNCVGLGTFDNRQGTDVRLSANSEHRNKIGLVFVASAPDTSVASVRSVESRQPRSLQGGGRLTNVIENLQRSPEMALLGQKRGRYRETFWPSTAGSDMPRNHRQPDDNDREPCHGKENQRPKSVGIFKF